MYKFEFALQEVRTSASPMSNWLKGGGVMGQTIVLNDLACKDTCRCLG